MPRGSRPLVQAHIGHRPANGRRERRNTTEIDMLATVAIILIVLWLLGLVTSYTMGGLIHILLVVALVVFVIRLLQGRKVGV
jgi:hypothetical protein